ncbi:elongation factor G [Candidatus Riflebacteria bacterium]
MKSFESAAIRNFGLIGHLGTGKTSLGEAILFNSGATNKLCSVEQKNSNFDFEPEEVSNQCSINAAIGVCQWEETKFNIIDTPGDQNYITEWRNALKVVDGVISLVSAVDGVEIQTIKSFLEADALGLGKAIFVNKMDRDRADFPKTVKEIGENLTKSAVPIQLPIGAEASFEGVVDIIKSVAYRFKKDDSGSFAEEAIPDDMMDDVAQARESLVEHVAETDDALLEKYLEEGALDNDEMLSALGKAIATGAVVPILCGSARYNIGIQPLMSLISSSFPSPVTRKAVQGREPGSETEVPTLQRACNTDEPFSGLVFKTIIDPYAGKLTIFRIFSGMVKPDSLIYNSSREERERIGHIFQLNGKKQESVGESCAGDIVAVAKLKETMTGDSFCDEKNPIVYDLIKPPGGVISFAVKPKSKGDEDKVATSLKKLREEDIALVISHDEITKDILLTGMGQRHIEGTVEKLKRKFNVEVLLETPKVPYKETITKRVEEIQGKYKKQTGGHGQFGDCWIHIEPKKRGEGFEFVDKIVGGVIPRTFIPAVEKGIIESMVKGVVAGYPVVDVKVELYFGSYHNVDSSEMAFKVAGSMAFKKAVQEANPVLLEPIMNMEIVVPEEYMGDIMGDLSQRRGKPHGMEPMGNNQMIKAQVPLAEILNYAPALDSITSGKGSFTMDHSHYEIVPASLADKVIIEAKRALEERDK